MTDCLTIKNNKFLDTIDLVNDSKRFLIKIEELYYSVEPTILSRLENWISYFNNNYNKFICSYSATIFGLISVAKNNPLFKTQTEYEFHISLKFYDCIFKSGVFIIINSTDLAKQLLNLSLVYGKYPGMVIHSRISSLQILKNGVYEKNLNNLFETLFIKYENPYILTNSLNSLTSIEIDALMHILQGNNIRNFDRLPFPISKKESFQFFNKRRNEYLKLKNNQMKNLTKTVAVIMFTALFTFFGYTSFAQESPIIFGKSFSLQKVNLNTKEKDKPIKWVNVNTDPDTWHVEKDLLICTGKPIGVMRSEKQYENFILHIEWMHMEAGGNSGTFVWSNATPPEGALLPDGVEVQMLELEWVNLNKRDGVTPPVAYVHGELFGVGGVTTVPDNPRGTRSKSIENRCKGKGEWNTYDVVCVDGVIKLSVNGKFVNGIAGATQKKGYICLESEGAPIHFRNIRIMELPSGVTSDEQIAPEIK